MCTFIYIHGPSVPGWEGFLGVPKMKNCIIQFELNLGQTHQIGEEITYKFGLGASWCHWIEHQKPYQTLYHGLFLGLTGSKWFCHLCYDAGVGNFDVGRSVPLPAIHPPSRLPPSQVLWTDHWWDITSPSPSSYSFLDYLWGLIIVRPLPPLQLWTNMSSRSVYLSWTCFWISLNSLTTHKCKMCFHFMTFFRWKFLSSLSVTLPYFAMVKWDFSCLHSVNEVHIYSVYFAFLMLRPYHTSPRAERLNIIIRACTKFWNIHHRVSLQGLFIDVGTNYSVLDHTNLSFIYEDVLAPGPNSDGEFVSPQHLQLYLWYPSTVHSRMPPRQKS